MWIIFGILNIWEILQTKYLWYLQTIPFHNMLVFIGSWNWLLANTTNSLGYVKNEKKKKKMDGGFLITSIICFRDDCYSSKNII